MGVRRGPTLPDRGVLFQAWGRSLCSLCMNIAKDHKLTTSMAQPLHLSWCADVHQHVFYSADTCQGSCARLSLICTSQAVSFAASSWLWRSCAMWPRWVSVLVRNSLSMTGRQPTLNSEQNQTKQNDNKTNKQTSQV